MHSDAIYAVIPRSFGERTTPRIQQTIAKLCILMEFCVKYLVEDTLDIIIPSPLVEVCNLSAKFLLLAGVVVVHDGISRSEISKQFGFVEHQTLLCTVKCVTLDFKIAAIPVGEVKIGVGVPPEQHGVTLDHSCGLVVSTGQFETFESKNRLDYRIETAQFSFGVHAKVPFGILVVNPAPRSAEFECFLKGARFLVVFIQPP